MVQSFNNTNSETSNGAGWQPACRGPQIWLQAVHPLLTVLPLLVTLLAGMRLLGTLLTVLRLPFTLLIIMCRSVTLPIALYSACLSPC